MNIRYYHVDAFSSSVFSGNPAGVCLLDAWIPDDVMQSIAAENRLPETAFLVGRGSQYELRWFTPKVEIDLCGHATLASAHVLFKYVSPGLRKVSFSTQSGMLSVTAHCQLLEMDFPARSQEPCDQPEGLADMLGAAPLETYRSRDLMAVFETEDQILSLRPDFDRLACLDSFGIIVTAPGKNSDFVSRFFAPGAGIPEDPVTGSSHCVLIPYWAERLGKTDLHAFQRSQRGGELFCGFHSDRVSIAGKAATYLTGTILV